MSKEHKVGLEPIKALEMLDKVSPTFCLAKWLQLTLNLHTGTNSSCCLTPPSRIELDRLSKNIHEFHNTQENKSDRQQLLDGKKAKSCQFCWAQENKGNVQSSERVYKSASPWAHENLEQVLEAKADKDIIPTYLEVSFSSKCNLKCAYCSPQTSSSIYHEVKKFGPYTDSSSLNDIREIEKNFEFSEFEEKNPYIPKFYEWFNKISKNLYVLRFTGGEPLLSENVFNIFDQLKNDPHPNLQIEINSNLSLPAAVVERLVKKVKEIPSENYKSLRIITSIDGGFQQTAYVRSGLNIEHLKRNIAYLLESLPDLEFRFTVTFNIFSVFNFNELIEYTLDLKRQYKTYDKILLSIYPLISPYHLSIKTLPLEFKENFEAIRKQLKKYKISDEEPFGFNSYEIDSFEKVFAYYLDQYPKSVIKKLQKDFYYFIKDYDHRKKTNLLKGFPELKSFYEHCMQLANDEFNALVTSTPSIKEDFQKIIMFYQRENSFSDEQREKVFLKLTECISRLDTKGLIESVAITNKIYNPQIREKVSNFFVEIFCKEGSENLYKTHFVWSMVDLIKQLGQESKKNLKNKMGNIIVDNLTNYAKENNEFGWAWINIFLELPVSNEERISFLKQSAFDTPKEFSWGIEKILKKISTPLDDEFRIKLKEFSFKKMKELMSQNDEMFWAWLEIINLLECDEEEVWSFIETTQAEIGRFNWLLRLYRWSDSELWIKRYNHKEIRHWVYAVLERNDPDLSTKFINHIKPTEEGYIEMVWFFLISDIVRKDILELIVKFASEENKKSLDDYLKKRKNIPTPTVFKRIKILKSLVF